MDANERRERATDEAAQWWTRLANAAPTQVSQTDRADFTAWLRESPLHVAEILRIAHVQDALERFKLWDQIPATARVDDDRTVITPGPFRAAESTQKRPPRRARYLTALAAAAVLALLTSLAAYFTLHSREQILATDRAERREVVLADGSVVSLEPETEVRIRLLNSQRLLTLERGRALFQVAKDPNRPFMVASGPTVVRAVGTVFGVEQTAHSVVVTVKEGKVAVRSTADNSAPLHAGTAEAPSHGASNQVLLTADEQITVLESGAAEPVKAVDSSRALAWSEGHLVFDSVPLREVAEEFNRYNRVRLRIVDPDLGRRPVSGVFQASDPETLIAFIQAGARVTVTRTDQDEILISPASDSSPARMH